MGNSSDLKSFYKKLGVVFGAGILMIVIVFLGLIPFIKYLGKPAYLDVFVLPEKVRVEIDGTEYRNAVYEFEPGSYVAKVSGEGVAELTVQLELAKNQTTTLYLNWLNETGEWKQYSADEMAHRNEIGGVLPMHLSVCGTPAKRINCDAIAVQFSRNEKCDNELCIAISGRKSELTEETLELVRENLANKGYNLADYRYFYVQNDAR